MAAEAQVALILGQSDVLDGLSLDGLQIPLDGPLAQRLGTLRMIRLATGMFASNGCPGRRNGSVCCSTMCATRSIPLWRITSAP
mgnify:CR=1 FL=1